MMPAEFDITGKVVFITGAGRGLGRAIARALAHAGADVALGLRDIESHGNLPAEIEADGRRVLPLQMDMTPGSRAGDDPAEQRTHHQHELAGRIRGPAHGIGVLHDQGRDCTPDQVPGSGMGQVQHYG